MSGLMATLVFCLVRTLEAIFGRGLSIPQYALWLFGYGDGCFLLSCSIATSFKLRGWWWLVRWDCFPKVMVLSQWLLQAMMTYLSSLHPGAMFDGWPFCSLICVVAVWLWMGVFSFLVALELPLNSSGDLLVENFFLRVRNFLFQEKYCGAPA